MQMAGGGGRIKSSRAARMFYPAKLRELINEFTNYGLQDQYVDKVFNKLQQFILQFHCVDLLQKQASNKNNKKTNLKKRANDGDDKSNKNITPTPTPTPTSTSTSIGPETIEEFTGIEEHKGEEHKGAAQHESESEKMDLCVEQGVYSPHVETPNSFLESSSTFVPASTSASDASFASEPVSGLELTSGPKPGGSERGVQVESEPTAVVHQSNSSKLTSRLQEGLAFYNEQFDQFRYYNNNNDNIITTMIRSKSLDVFASSSPHSSLNCCICRGLFTDLRQLGIYPGQNPLLLPEADCGRDLKHLHGASNLPQPEIVQILKKGFMVCCAWQKEAQVAKKKRHQLAGLWAVVVGRSVDLLMQQFRSLTNGRDVLEPERLTKNDWLRQIFSETGLLTYREQPLTVDLAIKFVRLYRYFQDERLHWLLHSGLAVSSLYNWTEESLLKFSQS